MSGLTVKRLSLLVAPLLLAGCLTDAATRIAYDIKAAAGQVGRANGSTHSLQHRTPSRRGECEGSYTVQLDKVGLLVIWCKDPEGVKTLSSHSTSYHRRFVDTSRTWIVNKKPGEPLLIDLERRDDRVLIVNAR